MPSLGREAAENGARLQTLRTDNGAFSPNKFIAVLANKKQSVRFSGVGAAHQNEVSEKAIQTVTYMASTMLIHASMRSPAGTIIFNHCPIAMDYATHVYNNVLKEDSGLSPNESWTRSKYNPTQETIGRAHVWGAPTYVLEPKL
eukprot:14132509-Ditylum_brightwellii.AAC.1